MLWKEKHDSPPPCSRGKAPACHAHATHMQSLSLTVKTNARAWRWLDNRATRTEAGKAWCGELSIEHRVLPLPAPPPTPRASLSPAPQPWAPAQIHSEVLLSHQSSQGTAASMLPTPGPRVTPRRALPSCGRPAGLLAQACSGFLRGKCLLQPQPLLMAPAPGRGGRVHAGCQ